MKERYNKRRIFSRFLRWKNKLREKEENDDNNFESSEELIKYCQKRAIDLKSDGIDCDTATQIAENEFPPRVNNVNFQYENKLCEIVCLKTDSESTISDIENNKEKYFQLELDNLPEEEHAKEDRLVAQISELETQTEEKAIELAKVRIDCDENKKKFQGKPIISKWMPRFLAILYFIVASFLNLPVFENVAINIPIGGLILAISMGAIEAMLSHYIGYCLAHGLKNRGKILISIASLLLLFILFRQFRVGEHPITASSFIILLFILSVVFSYSYYKDELKFKPYLLKKKLSTAIRKIQNEINVLDKNLARLRKRMATKACENLDMKIQNLKNSIRDNERTIQHLQIEKQNELEKLENIKIEIIAAIKSIYSINLLNFNSHGKNRKNINNHYFEHSINDK